MSYIIGLFVTKLDLDNVEIDKFLEYVVRSIEFQNIQEITNMLNKSADESLKIKTKHL